jgi:hypothetical protein
MNATTVKEYFMFAGNNGFALSGGHALLENISA